MNSVFLLDNFVTTRPGEPFRLFPFGKVVKGGIEHDITPEYAARFRLPHFKPPIKLGSHEEKTPAGGHITGLEVRDDGLYAIPEWNEKGSGAILDGAYRYHSPEVIWEDGALEDPTTGALMEGPMIAGDALLHTPHLGEAAKLYSIEPIHKGDEDMTSEFVQVPKGFWESFISKFSAQPEPEPKPEPESIKVAETEEFKAAVQERDNFKAQLDELKAEKVKADLLGAITIELQDKEKFGGMYVELKGAQEAAEVLATMDETQREWVMRNFKALIAQTDLAAIETENGETGGKPKSGDARSDFDAAIRNIIIEEKLDYPSAAKKAAEKHPELYKAYVNANKEQ